MLKEFKDFALKGNLIDMAVGVVMGAAFGTVTKAFIDGLFMPLVGLIFQVGDLNKAEFVLRDEIKDAAGVVSQAKVALSYGSFISSLINFLLVAFVMFLVVKAMNKSKKEEAPAPPPVSEVLLAEIRDLLKK
ncbi:MAG: large conductance mechanosensitive channel protein MscL [Saprospiraceae bacterium]|nr:large conductance mechanosensitive channel protein MscL [Saprospiraceae bacterium]